MKIKLMIITVILITTVHNSSAMTKGFKVATPSAQAQAKKAATPQALREVAVTMGAAGKLEQQQKAKGKAVPVGQAQTKAQTTAHIQAEAEKRTSAIFEKPIPAPVQKQKSIGQLQSWETPLDNAYKSTFTQIPGGKQWEQAFERINVQAWNNAIAQATSSLKSTEAAKIKAFNTRLTTFLKQHKSPVEVANISESIDSYLKTPGLSSQAKQIAQTIKNAADALSARINK